VLIFIFNPLEGHISSPGIPDPIVDPRDSLEGPTDDPSEWTAYLLKYSLELAGEKQEAEHENDGKNEGHTPGAVRCA
jgi:hypothetical protein